MSYTIMRGKSGKSNYMTLMHLGTRNSALVLYGHLIHMTLAEEKAAIYCSRPDETYSNSTELKKDLINIMKEFISQPEYRSIYLYGNFAVEEISVLEQVVDYVDGRLSIVATVQDNAVPDGQIIIEHRH